jgi:hypothetical protein
MKKLSRIIGYRFYVGIEENDNKMRNDINYNYY